MKFFGRAPLYSHCWSPRGSHNIPQDQEEVLWARAEEGYPELCGRLSSVPTEQSGDHCPTKVATTFANSLKNLD